MPTPQFGSKPEHLDKIRLAVEAKEKYGDFRAAEKAIGIDNSTLGRWYKYRHLLDDGLVAPAPLGHSVKGVSTLHKPDGSIAQQWIKTRNEPTPEETAEVIKAALAGIQSYAKLPPPPKTTDDDLATVYPLSDWHVGLLAWGKETGTDYDLSIAQRVIGEAMKSLVALSPPSKQAVVLGMGDLLHSDNYENRTTRSHNILDVDGRYPKVLTTAIQLVVQTIDLALQKHGKVLVRMLPGNHDDQSAIAVTAALGLFYSSNNRVEVDDDPSRFWWWTWGKVMLGATHGDMAKMKDLPMIMAQRRPDEWGKTTFRYIYTGHIHTQTGVEVGGVPVQSFRTPAAKDAWQHGQGYGAGRSVLSITHHKGLGEVGRNTWPVLDERVHGTGFR